MKKSLVTVSRRKLIDVQQTTASCGILRRRRANSIDVYTVLTHYFNPIKSDKKKKTARQERWRTGRARHSYATLRYPSSFFFLVQHSADLISCSCRDVCVCVSCRRLYAGSAKEMDLLVKSRATIGRWNAPINCRPVNLFVN